MAAQNQSIRELMAAETKASKIISEARLERGERLKQAKLEAEEEINEYRQHQENTFQMNNTDLLGDDSSVLDQEAEKTIKKMSADFHSNKTGVIKTMVDQVNEVHIKVPAGLKQ